MLGPVRPAVCVLLPLSSLLGCAGPSHDARGIDYPNAVTPALPVTPPAPAAPAVALAPPVALPSASAPPASPAFGSSTFALDAPLLIERASPDGHWVGLCTARKDSNGDRQLTARAGPRGDLRGDAFERYLVTPDEELPVDALLGGDATGRYALVMQRGALLLWDAESRKSLDLSALGVDARLSAQSFAELRTIAFDKDSRRLLYVRQSDAGGRLVVRNLEDGSERRLDPGPGSIWRACFDLGGAFIVVELINDDSNKTGRFDFPAPILKTPRPCSAGPGRYHTWVDRGDRPTTVLVPLRGGAPIVDPDLVMAFGDALLVRNASGEL